VATQSIGFRKVRGQDPIPVARIDSEDGLSCVLDRIRRVNDFPPRAAAHLFVSPDGKAFVLHQGHQALQIWERERWNWFVGAYGKPAAQFGMLAPTLEGLSEDITQHLIDLSA